MTLQNFDTELDVQGVTRLVHHTDIAVSAEATVKVSEARAFVAKPDEQWQWTDLRDYVVHEIEERFGAFPRDVRKESGIFKGFLNRWGDRASAIARAAFEVHDGVWRGAPISVNRFCKNCDPYFAEVIAERLSSTPTTGW